MKNASVDLASVRESVVILRCRGLELGPADRKELQRADAAFGHVFQKIHRIEWTVTARPRAVEVHVHVHARGGDYEGRGTGTDARTAFQVVTRKILGQKRNQKEASLGSRSR